MHAADHLARWAARRGVAVADLDEDLLARFVRHLLGCRCRGRRRGAHSKRVPFRIHAFLRYLREEGVVTTSAPETIRPQLVCEYGAWMRDRRGLAETTIAHSLPVAQALLGTVNDDPARLDATRVREFVLEYIRRHAPASAGCVPTIVRCFLRWLVVQGRCATDHTAAVPKAPTWRPSTGSRPSRPTAPASASKEPRMSMGSTATKTRTAGGRLSTSAAPRRHGAASRHRSRRRTRSRPTPRAARSATTSASTASVRAPRSASRTSAPRSPSSPAPDSSSTRAASDRRSLAPALGFTPSGATDEIIIPYVGSYGACGAIGGWYYEDDDIVVCPATCATLSGDKRSRVGIVLGCETQLI